MLTGFFCVQNGRFCYSEIKKNPLFDEVSMFKRTLLPLLTIVSLSAAEELVDHTAPVASTAVLAPQADAAEPTIIRPTAQSIMLIISHLQKGILIMEQDTNKECAQFMQNIAANARILLTKLMAIASMGKLAEYEEGLTSELIRELYQTYVRFSAKLEATYSQAAAPVNPITDDASANEESPTT